MLVKIGKYIVFCLHRRSYLLWSPVIVPKLEYAGKLWEGNAKFVKQLETVQMTAARKIPRRSSTTSNTVPAQDKIEA